MAQIVCTLFENDYHFGVASLVNSLIKAGFKGNIYAGYKGCLPPWAKGLKEFKEVEWEGAKILQVSDSSNIIFLPLNTTYHLTNYKPDFMLQLLETVNEKPESIYYFDPDIVVTAPWSFLANWSNCGVALCEDLNSPLEKFHPRRVAWRNYFEKYGIKLEFKNNIYVNGGFVALNIKDKKFLENWKDIQEAIVPVIGGLNRSSLTGTPLPDEAQGPYAPFGKTDQDALNIAIEASNLHISYIGKEGMGFKSGASVMVHALGTPKPWKVNYIQNIISGRVPGQTDKAYWNAVNQTIISCSPLLRWRKKVMILVALAIGRFYGKRR